VLSRLGQASGCTKKKLNQYSNRSTRATHGETKEQRKMDKAKGVLEVARVLGKKS
jgi:hypothetical protein